ncbi:hypothetical protein PV10_06360 [Exophiala mesophila]|uniref:PH domain-containing protein n=1 Tax=Exophiala mesophila TaxID=212818 RepID=A0A0D1ZD51_EXOME|nr:uncharacterized protein PV10_06360 [Exophiala mesophila]KIV91869.1 hypothetical protein PV10_06360 [Exophiala mesophila]
MGRLRNLSESWRSFRDPQASNSPPSRSSSNNHNTVVDNHSPADLQHSPADPPPGPYPRPERTASRPTSMVYTPPSMMDAGRDNHIEELIPVFSFLSSHSNKLYQEGYFLKLNDLDTSGRPNADRNWTECFAQLVGTVLSLWDAAALDAAGQEGEVAPTFINLADASLKMIETLPTRNPDVQPLQNVLSISTAGKNRYLLHFNSLHSLTQWTAGIRLSMFEHTSLQELYTGSLIAGKGKHLNNIKTIMERSRFVTEDWARVRFGAGTPWRRCWCVIEPPDEKEWQKMNKTMKKRSAYERPPTLPKGIIKFYDTKKTKKVTPIATITDAYSAYAIYPQSKPLIEQSTLVKLEGRITIHSKPESKSDGFVFVMPELHPAVSGFEMMLRWLFPVYDTFHLYGRPGRMIADTWDVRGLMFAMPRERHYGYLDIIDVAALIHTAGSQKWNEREWRKQMKEMTSKRMGMGPQARSVSNVDSRGHARQVSEQHRPGVHYADSSPTPLSTDARYRSGIETPPRVSQAPTNGGYLAPVHNAQGSHNRSVSESGPYISPTKIRQQKENDVPSRESSTDHVHQAPIHPPPQPPNQYAPYRNGSYPSGQEGPDSRYSSDSDGQGQRLDRDDIGYEVRESTPPAPVVAPPTFQHYAGEVPQKRPDARPDLRREKSRMSNATLSQIADVNKLGNRANIGHGGAAGHAAVVAWNGPNSSGPPPGYSDNQGARGVTATPNKYTLEELSANQAPSTAPLPTTTTTTTTTSTTTATAVVLGEYPSDSLYVQSSTEIPLAHPQDPKSGLTLVTTTQSFSPRHSSPSKHIIHRKPVPE